MNRVLHCYAIGRDGAWEAICLDLDLAVQGRSFDEVNQTLTQAIELHLEGVMALPEAERDRLLNRSVPFLTRLRFAWDAFFMSFRTRSGDGYRTSSRCLSRRELAEQAPRQAGLPDDRREGVGNTRHLAA